MVDGSYCPVKQLGTACWILTDGDEYKNKGSAQATGTISEMDPYQAELFGVYTLLLFIQLYCIHFKVNKGTIEIACDCLSAIEKGLLNDNRPKVSGRHHDMLIAIFDLRKSIKITLKFRHVYGHQDRKNRALDKWEVLNCECDLGAKCHMAIITKPLSYKMSNLYGTAWRISINKTYVNSDITGPIYRHTHGKDLLAHIAKRTNVPVTTLETVDWDAAGKAAKKTSDTKHINLVKYCSGFIGTGSMMVKQKEWLNGICPVCNKETETPLHLLTCDCEKRMRYGEM